MLSNEQEKLQWKKYLFFQKKVLTTEKLSAIILTVQHAGVAQWQSSWFVISRLMVRLRSPAPAYMGEFPSGQRGQTVNLLSLTSLVRIQLPPPTKKEPLSTKTKVLFLNDVCLRQMMLASPMMTASPNDAWLRHILWQTSHHCGTQWSNIILSEVKNIISPQAMHHLTSIWIYDIITKKKVRCGTSIGANIHEVQYAQGTRDFISKLHLVKQQRRT